MMYIFIMLLVFFVFYFLNYQMSNLVFIYDQGLYDPCIWFDVLLFVEFLLIIRFVV